MVFLPLIRARQSCVGLDCYAVAARSRYDLPMTGGPLFVQPRPIRLGVHSFPNEVQSITVPYACSPDRDVFPMSG
jgi:hypothetical protein